MITLMDTTEFGERCKSYLEGLLDGTDFENDSLVIWPHKHLVQVKDIDVFHQIAQKTDNRELSTTGGFNYDIKIITENDKECSLDYCTVSLPLDLSKDFRNKYGGKYTLRR